MLEQGLHLASPSSQKLLSTSLNLSKVALVIGGTRGLGRADAEDLATRNYTIVVASCNADKGNAIVSAITAAGGRASFTPCDVTKRSDIRALHAQLDAKTLAVAIIWECGRCCEGCGARGGQ